MNLRTSVYVIVALIPPGRVVSYGDIAGMLGMSPRMVGRYLALSQGADLPWWRVVNAGGELPAHVREQALQHWRDEDIELKPNGCGVPIRRYRADLAQLADAAEAALGPLTGIDDFTG
ncbi:MGMT family protein [Dermatophilaceae bacterium Sec6.4]